ncbi:unnamed protein product [Closterium sp. NIES-64]|nr:unnamed protein product [Closterium sp. NIES-64]
MATFESPKKAPGVQRSVKRQQATATYLWCPPLLNPLPACSLHPSFPFNNAERQLATATCLCLQGLLGNSVTGGGITATYADVEAAVNAAVADGVDVISLSLGGADPSATYFSDQTYLNANLAGTVVVYAAGNSGPPPLQPLHGWPAQGWPAQGWPAQGWPAQGWPAQGSGTVVAGTVVAGTCSRKLWPPPMNPLMYRSISNFSPFFLTVGARCVSGAFPLVPGELSGAFLLAPAPSLADYVSSATLGDGRVVKLYGLVHSGINLSSPFFPPLSPPLFPSPFPSPFSPPPFPLPFPPPLSLLPSPPAAPSLAAMCRLPRWGRAGGEAVRVWLGNVPVQGLGLVEGAAARAAGKTEIEVGVGKGRCSAVQGLGLVEGCSAGSREEVRSYCVEGALNAAKIAGKIVLCSYGWTSSRSKAAEVAGRAGQRCDCSGCACNSQTYPIYEARLPSWEQRRARRVFLRAYTRTAASLAASSNHHPTASFAYTFKTDVTSDQAPDDAYSLLTHKFLSPIPPLPPCPPLYPPSASSSASFAYTFKTDVTTEHTP